MNQNELPLGFGFALAQNPGAMKHFANLPAAGQKEILRKAHGLSSKDEMQALVDSLSKTD